MDDIIRLAHGSGGKLTHRLIEEVFLPYFSNPALSSLDDSALLNLKSKRVAFTTDSYVVDPIFFPGGDIGRLAVCGTVNDLVVQGARPVGLSVGFIIEEGFALDDLHRILASMKQAAEEADVSIVTGDTKVVTSGAADKIFINTAGVGELLTDNPPSGGNAQNGDAVILSGTLGDHGIAVMASREGINFDTEIESDVAPLNQITNALLDAGLDIHVMRDPTRGGLATTVNEIAKSSNVDIELDEQAIPVTEEVRGACELLGFDPIYIANEGKLVLFLPNSQAKGALTIIQKFKIGKNAAIIGSVTKPGEGQVFLKTDIGGHRIIDMLVGEQLPRIC